MDPYFQFHFQQSYLEKTRHDTTASQILIPQSELIVAEDFVMSEGGFFPWKRQVIDESRGPVTSYQGIHGPLPAPPKNMSWIQDSKTREWTLVQQHQHHEEALVEGILVDNNTSQDYIEHTLEPTDTFQGICLRYKITPTELRRANCFSGTNLALAPNPIRIPTSTATAVAVPVQDESPHSRESMIQTVMKKATIPRKEAVCFLEIHDWDVSHAVADAVSS